MAIKARCGRAEDLPPGSSKVVQVREHMVAIFNVDGHLHAIDNSCPHQGGPLGEGYLEDDAVVSCPWHGWTFSVRTGVSPIDPDMKVACYAVRIESGEIVVEIPS
jgi:NAD(P)H-dependent nitrite reductase small subunit